MNWIVRVLVAASAFLALPAWAGCGEEVIWPEGLEISIEPYEVDGMPGQLVKLGQEENEQYATVMTLICAKLPRNSNFSLQERMEQNIKDYQKTAKEHDLKVVTTHPVEGTLGNLIAIELEAQWRSNKDPDWRMHSILRIAKSKNTYYAFGLSSHMSPDLQRQAYEKLANKMSLQ